MREHTQGHRLQTPKHLLKQHTVLEHAAGQHDRAVGLGLVTAAAHEGRVTVTVADEGAGLSPVQKAIVFDKFERLGRGGDGGSGLGLYISRRLARAMGGDLTVECAPGEGARFTLSLPLSQSMGA